MRYPTSPGGNTGIRCNALALAVLCACLSCNHKTLEITEFNKHCRAIIDELGSTADTTAKERIKKLGKAAIAYRLRNGKYPASTKETFLQDLYLDSKRKGTLSLLDDESPHLVLFLNDRHEGRPSPWDAENPPPARPDDTDFCGPLVSFDDVPPDGTLMIWQKRPFADGSRYIYSTNGNVRRVSDVELLEHALHSWRLLSLKDLAPGFEQELVNFLENLLECPPEEPLDGKPVDNE